MDVRPAENRYGRQLRRYNLALQFIRHEVRTATIREWTGLSQARIHQLYLDCRHERGPIVVRHRGCAPTQTGRFLRSERARVEGATLAGICYVLEVLPVRPLPNANRALPDLTRGERLCAAFEYFRRLIPETKLTLEQAIALMRALAQGTELALTHCVGCGAVLLLDPLGVSRHRCITCTRVGGIDREARHSESGRERTRLAAPLGQLGEGAQGELFGQIAKERAHAMDTGRSAQRLVLPGRSQRAAKSAIRP